jgi:opacity protein-like surface antigen
MFCSVTTAHGLDIYTGVMVGQGTAFADDYAHGGGSFGGMLGISVSTFRGEIEYNYIYGRRSAGKVFAYDSKIKAHSGMLNGYILMPTPMIKPYIGAGIGSVFAGEISNQDISPRMAYQGMVGLQLKVPFLPLFADVETRVLYSGRVTQDYSLTQWDGRLKVRYAF